VLRVLKVLAVSRVLAVLSVLAVLTGTMLAGPGRSRH